MDDPNGQVQIVLDELVAEGSELGLQVAVYRAGKLIVDAWAGLADEASSSSVDAETLFNMSSCGKGVAATCLHILADRQLVSYDAAVADYWPEFGAHGKQGITVRHVLSHRSGIPRTPAGYGPGMLVDWDTMCAGIAELEPIFAPGSKTAYQAVNYGFIVGEIIRRVDGRPIGEFLRGEVAEPLGAPALFFGVPRSALERVATIRDALAGAPRIDTPAPTVSAATFNRNDVRQAAIPSSGGIANARSLARHYAALALGGALDGVRLLSEERVRTAVELQTDEIDELYKVAIKRSLGYRLADDTGPGAGPSAFGHVGNGMFAYADPDRAVAVAFLRNSLASPPSGKLSAGERVMAALSEALHETAPA
jgi:CubicO group peptidase (beta-lactamase class C family)